MSREDIRLSPAWAAVLISVAGIVGTVALGAGRVLYAPKGDYATKSDVDSLRWEVRRIGSWIGVPSLERAQRTGRRP